MVVVPEGYYLDEFGNVRSSPSGEVKGGRLHISCHYILEEGKTTLRGRDAMLASPPQCVHSDRLSCDHGDGFHRCEYMQYEAYHWVCGSKG